MSDPTGQGADRPGPSPAPVVSWDAPPPVQTTPVIELWSPQDIGWASFLLGYPGAVVLAALNWRRLGRNRKAIVHLAAAVISSWALVLSGVAGVSLLLGIGVGYYLFRVQRDDRSSAVLGSPVASRSGLQGAVLALVGTIVIVGSGALVAVAVEGAGSTHRGQVLFSTRAATDACTPIGQASAFGLTDSIFLVAVMRETVRDGSHVVYEIHGPGLDVGPLPVTVTPPFDCIRTTDPIGPVDAGTYVVRYRYAGEATTQDLASGTFTVTPGPTSSPASSPAPGDTSSGPVPSTAAVCPGQTAVTHAHQAPEIESLLPAAVGGRPLARWSVRGQCWLQLAFSTRSEIDAFVGRFTTANNPNPVDDSRLVYGVAGRSNTTTDPPFFAFAAVRPVEDDEIGLALSLLVGLAGFHDIAAAIDLSNYQERTIAGKDVFVGTADMLDQNTHQRGRPYLYENDRYMFVVVTDDDAWAAEAIGSLP